MLQLWRERDKAEAMEPALQQWKISRALIDYVIGRIVSQDIRQQGNEDKRQGNPESDHGQGIAFEMAPGAPPVARGR